MCMLSCSQSSTMDPNFRYHSCGLQRATKQIPNLRPGLKMPEFQQPLLSSDNTPELGYKEGYCFCWTKSHSVSIFSFICYMNLLSRHPNLPKADAGDQLHPRKLTVSVRTPGGQRRQRLSRRIRGPCAPAPAAAVAAPAPAPTPEGGTTGSEVKDPVVGGSLRWSVSFPGSGRPTAARLLLFGFLVALSLLCPELEPPYVCFCFLEVC